MAVTALLTLAGSLFMTTCTIGLGDSVDTKPPAVEITYPPVQSIIRNTFTIRGSASDESTLARVVLEFTNTDTSEVFDGYQAVISEDAQSWSFVANNQLAGDVFELADGPYEVKATAIDGAGRRSVATTTYEIDNTAPVLVVNRPGTPGPLGGVSPEVYGSELKLTGSANDDQSLDLVSLQVYTAGGLPVGDPLTYSNVSGVGMDILLAKYYESPSNAEEQALTDRYEVLYDTATGGTQSFYCLVDISDYAREYDPPAAVASADNSRGNVSQSFWLYNEIYSAIFSATGYSLTMRDLTDIFTGRFPDAVLAGEVLTYLEGMRKTNEDWPNRAVTFSLNPQNSPYYQVIGYEPISLANPVTASQASTNMKVSVRISAGRDLVPLDAATFVVYLDPCDSSAVPLDGTADDIVLTPTQMDKTGEDYLLALNLGVLDTGSHYLLVVEGEDQSGNTIEDLNGAYGFTAISSGNPPIIQITSPSDLANIGTDSVTITGTVEAESGFDSLVADVSITSVPGGVLVSQDSYNLVEGAWSFDIENLSLLGTDDLYIAEILLTATDLQNNETTALRRLHIDQKAPVITSITYPDVSGVNNVVGATPEFRGNASDGEGTGIVSVEYSLDNITWREVAGTSIWNAIHAFEEVEPEGSKTLYVRATDAVGHVTNPPFERDFIFDRQRPTVTIDDGSEQFAGGEFSLAVTASDTYGIDRLVITQVGDGTFESNITLNGQSGTDYSYTINGLPRDPGNIDNTVASVADGTYEYQIQAYDTAGKISEFVPVTVTIDTTAPETNTITAPAVGAVDLNALSGNAYIFRGIAQDAGVGVERVWYRIDTSPIAPVVPAGDSPVSHGYVELAAAGNWNFTRNLVDYTVSPAENELSEGVGYNLHVIAEDKSGNLTAAVSVEFDIDRSSPVANEITVGVTTLVNRRVGFTLNGTAADTHGIASVSITQSMDGGAKLLIPAAPSLTATGTGYDWTLDNLPRGNTVGTIGSQALVDGSYEYEITVTDVTGKTHTIIRRIRFDSTGPELQVTSPENASWVSTSSVTVRGLATDLTSVGGVYYVASDPEPSLPPQPPVGVELTDADWIAAGWTAAGGTPGSWEIALSSLSEGTHSLWISAMDTNANMSAPLHHTFGVDTALPVLSGVNTPLADMNSGFSLSGSVTDTNALASPAVVITQTRNGVDPVEIDAIPGAAIVNGHEWSLDNLPRDPLSPADQIDFVPANDGVYEYVITATDAAGKKREITRTVTIDTTPPEIVVENEATLSGWISSPSLPVSGTVNDAGSGVSIVQYSLNSGALQALSVSGVNWSGNIPLSSGSGQDVYFTVTDRAGNSASSGLYLFSVDLDLPVLTVDSPAGPQRTNLLSALTAEYTASDPTSGVANVLITAIGGNAINAGDQTSLNNGDGTWTVSVPSGTLGPLGLVSGQSYVVVTTVYDTAGNIATQTFSIIVDTTDPSVAITAPVNGAEINKEVAITGTASDAQMLERVDLFIEDAGTGMFPAVPVQSFTGGSAYNWSYTFDTEAWNGAGYNGPVDIRVVATDEAGNSELLEHTYTIDQESDRPRIRSNNVEFDDSDPGYYPTTLQMTKNVIGTIEDDDGAVSLVEIWNAEISSWDTITLSGISFIYATPGDDGDKILRFRITDAAGTTFETDTALAPKFEWGTGAPGEFDYTEREYKVDTRIPTAMEDVYVNRNGEATFGDATLLVPNMPFGGTSAVFVLWLGADDENGIETITVTVPGATPAVQTLTTLDEDLGTGLTGYQVFRSAPIDVGSVADGSLTIDIEITDNSGLVSTASRTIFIDNAAPIIDYSYPEHETDQVFGNLTISGLASDEGSGLQSIEYKIGNDYAAQPLWNAATRSGASWTISDFASGTRIEAFTRKEVSDVDIATNILTVTGHGYVDDTEVWIGADELPGGLAHSTPYYVRDAAADTFRLATSPGGAAVDITSAGDTSVGVSSRAVSADNNIWYLPVMIRAVDKAGNVFETAEWDYRIKVDPSGDKPTVFITYPDADTTEPGPNPIVGGTIRMSGYAIDNVDVSEVYMQIDADGDGLFNAADDSAVSVAGTPVAWYGSGNGLLVNGSRNWNMNINTEGEFNPPAGSRRLIMYRVRARDNNGLYGSWTDPHYFEIDEGVPKFDELVFEQGGRTRTYEPDMWLSGDWTLTGTIMDESNIGVITVGNTPGASASLVSGTLSTPGWFTITSSGSLYGYEMAIPVNTETVFPAGQTSHSFTISATDLSDPPMTASREIRINYDNNAPNVTAVYGGALPIRNSNGHYELNSSVVEAESGFDRVLVVLHRPASIALQGGRVYNPLYGTGDARNFTAWGSLTESAEGLPLREYIGATRSDTTSLTLAGISSDPYARVGYYLMIGGMYYLITDVTGDTITWEGDVDVGETAFALVYAMAVDKLTTEIVDGDGDGIIEAVSRSGGTYDWSCSIDSTNLPDGQMHIRYVAFDKAGNHASPADIVTRVENNPPLLAKVSLATDIDGNATITDGSGDPATINEWNPPYSTLVAGAEQKIAAVAAADFTAKDFMEVVIDVVGGNGDLQYELEVDSTTVHSLVAANLRTGEYNELDPSTDTITVTRDQLSAMGDAEQDFIFTIWDSTETYALGASTDFMAELTVTLTVDVIDDVHPVTVVSPFYWNNASDNSLYGNSRLNGHIELEDDLSALIFNQASGLFDTDPKVSGQISIRGTSYDDQRITALWMYIGDTAADGNFSFPPTVATETFGGKTYYRMATFTPGTGWEVSASVMATNGWVFSVTDEYLNQSGHLVNWKLDWDTAGLDTIAAVDRYVRIVAEDKRTDALGNPAPNPSSETLASNPGEVATNNVPYYRMDVVPYVTAISTADNRTLGGLKDVNIRSSDGKYSVLQGSTATFMTLTGFNLDPDAVRIVASADVETNTVGTTSGIGVTHAAGATTTTMTVSNDISSSGYLEVFTNGVRALNNVNDDDAAGSYTETDPLQLYNREPDLYVRKNPTLSDNRYIRLFNMKDTGVKNGYYPEMLLEGDDPVFAYLNFSGGPGTNPGTAAGTGAGTYRPTNAMPQRAKFNGTTAAEITTEYLIKGLAWDQMAMARDEGGRFHHVSAGNYAEDRLAYVYDRYAELHSAAWLGTGTGWVEGTHYNNYDTYGGNFANFVDNNAISMDSNSYAPGLLVGRYQGLKMKVTGNSRTNGNYATVFMAYYDDNTEDKDLLFRNFRVGRHASVGNALYSGGTSSTGDAYAQSTNIGDPEDDTRLIAATSASKHFDIGITSGGRVVIIYYDESNSRLYLRYSNAAVDGSNPDGVIAWTTSSVTFPSYVGNYVSMDIDGSDGIHISAYNAADGDLAYLYLPSYSSTALEHVTVDATFSVGYWTKIKVLEDGGTITPYIAYYNSTENGQRDTIKLAYTKSGITAGSIPGGVDGSGYTTGDWEYLNVPAITPPQGGDNRFKQVSLDFDTANRPVVGYLGTNIEFGTWVDE